MYAGHQPGARVLQGTGGRQALSANGYDVQGGVQIGEGKAADLVATKGDRKAAIEIETGRSDPLPNVQKCLDAGKDEVIVMVTSAQADKKIQAGLADISQAEVIEASAALKQEW